MDLLRYVPLGVYLESPVTWLHRLDVRVKIAWLLSILLSPILATGVWRLGIVAFLVLVTLASGLPRRVWIRQLGLVLALSLFAGGATALAPEALGVTPAPQRQGADVGYGFVSSDRSNADNGEIAAVELSALPAATSYRYVLVKAPFGLLGRDPIQVTRRTLTLGIRFGTLLFTLLYSTTLFLLVTAPEEMAESLALMA
ncbi:MAG: CbiQ family ECF transporter T component, partial [Cyanobacteria bacterium J06648_11]